MKLISKIVVVVFVFMTLSCEKNSESRIKSAEEPFIGQLIGGVENNETSLLVSLAYIQKGLEDQLKQSENHFKVKSADIVKIQEKYFLRVLGINFENCRIPLDLKNGLLFEGDHRNINLVVCHGKGQDGCEPKLDGKSWYCSESSEECVKTELLSPEGIFKYPFKP